MPDKPVIPVGDVVRQFKLPGWLRWLLDLVKGTKIHAGPVDIQLDRGQVATPPRTGLDEPRVPGPSNIGPLLVLLALPMLMGMEKCPTPNPTPTPSPTPTPPPPIECLPGVPWCNELVPPATCSTAAQPCKHNPTGDPAHCELAPACPTPPPVCPEACPDGQECTDPTVGCEDKPTPPPGSCTIPLNGDPKLDVYLLYPRVADATPKIYNGDRCNLPEVGYPGRLTCPVCAEGCEQREACEIQLMGGPAPVWAARGALTVGDEDGWKARIYGDGTGEIRGCYPNGKACSGWITLTCTSIAGCKPAP